MNSPKKTRKRSKSKSKSKSKSPNIEELREAILPVKSLENSRTFNNEIRGQNFSNRLVRGVENPHLKEMIDAVESPSKLSPYLGEEEVKSFTREMPEKRMRYESRSVVPKIRGITLLCFCHGAIPMRIGFVKLTKSYNDLKYMDNFVCTKDERDDDTKHSCRFKDGKKFFDFSYNTVKFEGRFTNAGSCLGLKVAATSQEPFDAQNRVYSEKERLIRGDAPLRADIVPRVLYDNVRELCRSSEYKNMDFSTTTEFTGDDTGCVNLFIHDNDSTKSLLNKEYTSYSNETVLTNGSESELDVYKFVMLLALEVDGSIVVHKTILLGTGVEESLIELAEILGDRTICDEYLSSMIIREKSGIISYSSNTKNIIKFINAIKDEDTKLNFYDKSCNIIFDSQTKPAKKKQIEPHDENLLLRTINYYLNYSQYLTGEGLFG
uniref:Uncharacterized protein n=1 Tax=viral metagenome TaxID=1070528 RepID=A0A6C0HRU9_9ZZZZ